MTHFLDFIEAARAHGVGFMSKDGDHQKRRPLSPKDWSYIAKVQPFVFSFKDEGDMGFDAIPKEEFERRTEHVPDAPFPVFSMEMENPEENLGYIHRDPIRQDMENNRIELNSRGGIDVKCIVCIETSPNQFMFFTSVKTSHSRLSVVMPAPYIIRPIVKIFLDRINAEQLGMESTRTNVKLGSGKEKIMHRIRRIIHVRPKKYSKSPPSLLSNTIDWTHRFEVRGHWRKFEGVGKDREGIQNVQGFTWVSHYIKGSEDLPLVKKVRVVTGVAARDLSTPEKQLADAGIRMNNENS